MYTSFAYHRCGCRETSNGMVNQYGAKPQITAVTGFTKVSSGNPVYVKESSGSNLAFATDGDWVHHLHGELISDDGDCGPSRCFTFQHTDDGTNTATETFRVKNSTLSIPLVVGDCIEVVMPLGYYTPNDQLDVVNYDWFRWYGNSGGR